MRTKLSLIIALLLSSSLLAIKYQTNFMWTNDTINNANEYVFPTIRKKIGWDINVAEWISNWLKGNPKGEFVFWYNKNTVLKSQLDKTVELFNKLVKDVGGEAKLILKDINDLPLVKQHQKIFLDPRITYTKVDLLRLIAALDYVEKCGSTPCAFVYADIDKGFKQNPTTKVLEPLSLTEDNLFNNQSFQEWKKYDPADKTTPLDDLKKSGLLTRRGENNFFVLSNHQPHLLKAMKLAVLEPMFLRTLEYYQPKLDGYEKEFGIKPFSIPMIKQHKDKIPAARHKEISAFYKSIIQEVFESMVNGPLAAQFLSLKGQLKLLYDNQKYPTIVQAWLAQIPFTRLDGAGAFMNPSSAIKLGNLNGQVDINLLDQLPDTFGGLDAEGSSTQTTNLPDTMFK